ncbi:MAG: hypothetical protein DWQ09_05175 [Proteobacteria bacterium]|nr:MAG: hypothetical protein DWQ09_05175 [Pseudomonadota bacterium]QKK11347.1 MAG: M67 family metallopeptidase [Pseudomonadota bacterium]
MSTQQLASITLPRPLVNQILHHAQCHVEREVCGLIGGIKGVPTSLYPVTNVATDPRTRYEMDPREQITAQCAMRERGEELWAIYHSHPESPAVPSAEDIKRLSYPDALYLIVSLNTKGVLELQGFRWADKAMHPVELTIQ